jgi:hypothetical protein
MSRSKKIGLLATAAAGQSFLALLPRLNESLGPVFSPAKRATPRIVSALKAGTSTAELKDFECCETILLCTNLPNTLTLAETLLEAGLNLQSKLVVLCEEAARDREAATLLNTRTEVGKISSIAGLRQPFYLLEGGSRLQRLANELLHVPRERIMCLEPGGTQLSDGAQFLAEEFCLPLLEMATDIFEQAGAKRSQARKLTCELMAEAVEDAGFAGRRRWKGILGLEKQEEYTRVLEQLSTSDTRLADFAHRSSLEMLKAMQRNTDWLRGSQNGSERQNGKPKQISGGSRDQPIHRQGSEFPQAQR